MPWWVLFSEKDSGYLAAVMVGRWCLVAAFGVIYFYTTELFPTEIRNSVLGASSTVGRISGLGAAFIGGPLVISHWVYNYVHWGYKVPLNNTENIYVTGIWCPALCSTLYFTVVYNQTNQYFIVRVVHNINIEHKFIICCCFYMQNIYNSVINTCMEECKIYIIQLLILAWSHR